MTAVMPVVSVCIRHHMCLCEYCGLLGLNGYVFAHFVGGLSAIESAPAVCNCTAHVSVFNMHLIYILGE